MNKQTITILGIFLISGFVFFAMANALLFSKSPTGASVLPPGGTTPRGEVQVVQLSASGINYSPAVITVRQNQPVRLVADVQTLQGCLRSFVIPAFNVRKVFTEADNTLEFTPTQKGSFPFSCSMGMGRGTINVI